MKRSIPWIVLTGLASFIVAGSALAQAYLSQPIKIVFPGGAGTVGDTVARVLAQALSVHLSQPFIVENRVGADGIVGTESVARASPDGTTLLAGTSATHAANSALRDNLPYDPVRDFSPISHVGNISYVLVVGPTLQARTFDELAALARAQPGKLTYATGATPGVVAMEIIKRAAGIDVLSVPYKTLPQALNDIIAGRVDMTVADLGIAIPLIKSGKLRPIVVTQTNRSPLLPDVPSFPEANLPKVDVVGWWAWYAPAGTPAEARNRIYDALRKVTAQSEVRERLARVGAELTVSSPSELELFQKEQSAMYGRMIREAGVKLQ